jgi:beta-galactosidase
MSTGYESGGYGLIELDGKITARAERAGQVANIVQQNSEILRNARPVPSQVAIVFNPLTPLLGGEQNYGNRLAMHQSVAGYHRMFFERNIATDVVSAREMTAASLATYKLVVLPYPLMMTQQMSDALKAYVQNGGHLWMEARAGWVDEKGHAQPALPGFGWNEIAGVREKTLEPAPEFTLRSGNSEFKGMTFRQRFESAPDARALLNYDDGLPAAYERDFGKGKVAVLGTFVGQANQTKPIDNHPLGEMLINWASLQQPAIRGTPFVEMREMRSSDARIVFLFNHAAQPASIELKRDAFAPNSSPRELTRGEAIRQDEKGWHLDLPPESVRILVFK